MKFIPIGSPEFDADAIDIITIVNYINQPDDLSTMAVI